MSFKGKKGLGNRFLNSWYKFLCLNGKEDYKCWMRVVWLNVCVEIWSKHEDCLYGCQRQRRLWRVSIISSCSSPLQSSSEGLYPKKTLIGKRTMADDFWCSLLHFTCPEFSDTNHSQCQPNSARPRRQSVLGQESQDMAVAMLEEGSSFTTWWAIQRNPQLASETISCRSPNSLCFRALILSPSFKFWNWNRTRTRLNKFPPSFIWVTN